MSGRVVVLQGDAAHLPLPDASVDSVVCDPPYGLEFMGAEWDGVKGFRRTLNAADAGRDSVFGRTSRTSPEYSTGKPPNARIRTRVDGRTNPAEGKSVTVTPEAYIAGQPFQAWCRMWAAECLRVLKPGGWLLAFGGTRTWHRLTCGIEDAGFDIRDGIADLIGQDAPGLMWVYGSGFAKSKDAARAVDMHVCPLLGRHCMRQVPANPKPDDHVCPESEEGSLWRGWGTAAKPAWEPIVCARKPFAGSLGQNLVEYGVGALNVDGCRVGDDTARADRYRGKAAFGNSEGYRLGNRSEPWTVTAGRWVPNVLVTHSPDCERAGMRRVRSRSGSVSPDVPSDPVDAVYSDRSRVGWQAHGDADGTEIVEAWNCAPDCPAAELDRQSGSSVSRIGRPRVSVKPGDGWGMTHTGTEYADAGGASRFFPAFRYEAKAPASERPRLPDGTAWPTVKPLPLVSYLVRLVTPPGGTVGDFFCGTGTTGEAAILEGFDAILMDKDPQAIALTRVRLAKPMQPAMFAPEPAVEPAPARNVPPPPDSLFDLDGAA